MKSLRQQAYEAGVDLELSRRSRSRRYHVVIRRFERLIAMMVSRSTSEAEAMADFDWLWGNLRQRFPDLPWDSAEKLRGEA